jgi:hypothetical protein
MVRSMRKPFRSKVRAKYQTALEREVYRTTRRMIAQAIASETPKLTVKIVGPRRQAAYMMVGWSPEAESQALDYRQRPLGHTILTLTLEVPDIPW